jgi:hypothetical protein
MIVSSNKNNTSKNKELLLFSIFILNILLISLNFIQEKFFLLKLLYGMIILLNGFKNHTKIKYIYIKIKNTFLRIINIIATCMI